MKTKKVRSPAPSAGSKLREIVAKISAAQKQVEAARKLAKEAKLEFKRVRKAHRQAKKAVKEARREYKALKKTLAAAHATTVRPKGIKPKPPARVRRTAPVSPGPSASLIPAEIPAPAVTAPEAPLPDETALPETRAEQ